MDESSSDDLDQPAVIRRTPGPRTATKPAPERAAEPEPEPHTGDLRVGMAEPTVPTNIYRARRPAVALFLVLPAVVVALFLVRAFAMAAFGHPFSTQGVIASSLALASLPLLVAGLYGLITGRGVRCRALRFQGLGATAPGVPFGRDLLCPGCRDSHPVGLA